MNAHSGGPPKALEQSYALKARTKNFAIRIVKLYRRFGRATTDG